MTDVLNVSLREEVGTRPVRRLRSVGRTPAVLYGHGLATVSLAVATAEVEAAIRHGSKLVDLQGDLSEKALIRSVQWDSYGSHVLHLDLTRVSEQERVVISVGLDLKGEASGAKDGGMVEHHLFELEVECSAVNIPERLSVSVRELQVGHSITAADVVLPEHVQLITPADTVVVSCSAQGLTDELEEEVASAGPGEPEIIGRKPDESEEQSD